MSEEGWRAFLAGNKVDNTAWPDRGTKAAPDPA